MAMTKNKTTSTTGESDSSKQTRNSSPLRPDADNSATQTNDHRSLRDPEEPTEGPLRLDDTNYSVERLTPLEGGYNTYGDDYESYLDEEEAERPGRNPHFPESSQQEILEDLPSADMQPGDEPPLAPGDSLSDDIPASFDGDANTANAPDIPRSDQSILDEINDVLATFAGTDIGPLDVRVADGVVMLDGQVEASSTRTQIEQAVDVVPGVNDIRNRLKVRGEREYPRWSDE